MNKTEFTVDNKEFFNLLVDYHARVKAAQDSGEDIPQIPNSIGTAIYKICTGISMRPNFRGYTYRDEMVSDAIEDCVKAVLKYNPDAATRSGNPNAHSYFSTTAYWAMVRRITSEQKEVNKKLELIKRAGMESFISIDADSRKLAEGYMNDLRSSTSSFEKDKKKSQTGEHHGWGKLASKNDDASEI